MYCTLKYWNKTQLNFVVLPLVMYCSVPPCSTLYSPGICIVVLAMPYTVQFTVLVYVL